MWKMQRQWFRTIGRAEVLQGCGTGTRPAEFGTGIVRPEARNVACGQVVGK